MAEGIGRALADGDFDIRSAGINAGGVNRDAIASMKQVDIDISSQASDRLTAAHYEWADYIVTVCDSAERACPVAPPGKVTIHWSVPDPYGDYSNEEEKKHSFASIRDLLQRHITSLFEGIRNDP